MGWGVGEAYGGRKEVNSERSKVKVLGWGLAAIFWRGRGERSKVKGESTCLETGGYFREGKGEKVKGER